MFECAAQRCRVPPAIHTEIVEIRSGVMRLYANLFILANERRDIIHTEIPEIRHTQQK